jgi:phosphatidate cytidylyltransferase
MYSLFGLFYLGFLPTFFLKIHGSASGVHWTMVFLLINWASDTGAYFAGKKYGKTKLYPLISPKKTREGALGGLACAWVVIFIYKVLLFGAMGWGAVIIVPLLVGVASQVGDLCESFLKRAFDKKDSGSILPGHGGFLDRFDGVVFSLPIMYACTRVFS